MNGVCTSRMEATIEELRVVLNEGKICVVSANQLRNSDMNNSIKLSSFKPSMKNEFEEVGNVIIQPVFIGVKGSQGSVQLIGLIDIDAPSIGNQAELFHRLEKKSADKSKISEALKYIQKNLNKPLTLKQVADQVYYSQGYFCKLFKKEVGVNFIEYLNRQRVREACRLLVSSDLKIEQIGKKCGFSKASYFCKIFKNTTNVSPAVYRKENKRINVVFQEWSAGNENIYQIRRQRDHAISRWEES